MMLAILFDLDDTLIVGRTAALAALEAMAAFAELEVGLDGARLRAASPSRQARSGVSVLGIDTAPASDSGLGRALVRF